jgi:membrane protein DedA with SNARE-associated domain
MIHVIVVVVKNLKNVTGHKIMDDNINILINQLGNLSYLGIFITAFLSNVFIPIPEEIILLLFGFVSRVSELSLLLSIILITIGLLISDILMYLLSRKNNKLVTYFYKKFFSKILEVKGDRWIVEHIKKVIFFSRFMIQFRFLGPFLAGQKQVSFKTFLLYDFLALLVYINLYIFLGRFFHQKLNLIIDDINIIKNIVLLIFILIIIFSIN